jgi:hypothetical protein
MPDGDRRAIWTHLGAELGPTWVPSFGRRQRQVSPFPGLALSRRSVFPLGVPFDSPILLREI